jgi:hypothetical protein
MQEPIILKKPTRLIRFQIWREGYESTGEHGTATYFGTWLAESFDQAVKYANELRNLGAEKTGNHWIVWGCRLFDNEKDARLSFG